MIVIGLDVHKQSVTAVAVDEAGRPLDEKLIPVGSDELLAWAAGLDGERLWAVEDCRHADRVAGAAAARRRRAAGAGAAEADGAGAAAPAARAASRTRSTRSRSPERRCGSPTWTGRGRRGGAAARAEAAGRSPRRPRRRAAPAPSSGCAGTCTQLDPTFEVPLRRARPHPLSWSGVGRWLARQRADELQVRLARELARPLPAAEPRDRGARPASSNSAVSRRSRRGCSSCPAARPSPPPSCSAEIGPIDRFRSDAQLARHSRRRTARSQLRQTASATGSTAAATANSTAALLPDRRSPKAAYHAAGTRLPRAQAEPRARAAAKRSAASNGSSSAPSTHTLKDEPALT